MNKMNKTKEIIQKPIQPDMKALADIIQLKKNYVVNDLGLTSMWSVYGDTDSCGLVLTFNSPNSLSHVDKYELFLGSPNPVEIDTEHLFKDIYTMTVKVTWGGVEPAEFSCTYDFDSAKGLPESIYQAYAYLRSQLNLPLETFLEVFAVITEELPTIKIKLFHKNPSEAMRGDFLVGKALVHDMQTQQLTTT